MNKYEGIVKRFRNTDFITDEHKKYMINMYDDCKSICDYLGIDTKDFYTKWFFSSTTPCIYSAEHTNTFDVYCCNRNGDKFDSIWYYANNRDNIKLKKVNTFQIDLTTKKFLSHRIKKEWYSRPGVAKDIKHLKIMGVLPDELYDVKHCDNIKTGIIDKDFNISGESLSHNVLIELEDAIDRQTRLGKATKEEIDDGYIWPVSKEGLRWANMYLQEYYPEQYQKLNGLSAKEIKETKDTFPMNEEFFYEAFLILEHQQNYNELDSKVYIKE